MDNIEICTVGGFSEVGRNMTAIKYKDDVVIIDMGINVAKVIDHEEQQEYYDKKEMIAIEAIPDDSVIDDWKDKVKAILLTHAHLDHIAAVPFLAKKYNCPIIATPYTIEVLKATLKDKKKRIPNKLIPIKLNSTKKLTKDIKAEFIEITHSVPQAAMIVIHTPKGRILYTNDYKFDDTPTMGNPPDYEKLKSLAPLKCLITDSLYSKREGHTPSEAYAKELLKKVMLEENNENRGLIITCFSSHIARLQSIIEFGQKTKRDIVFLGRSLRKYVKAAEDIGLVNFTNKVMLIGFSSKIRKKLKQIEKARKNYLIVCTGNQGEKGAVLTKMVHGYFHFKPKDHVIFSSSTIPTEPNISQRLDLERRLIKNKVKISLDIHASGHCSRGDTEKLIKLTKPQNIIPAHGPPEKVKPIGELAKSLGVKNIHIMTDGKRITI